MNAKLNPVPNTHATAKTASTPYSGYYKREVLPEDPELTHTDPGSPLGEFMRRFWQPVCLSEQLKDLAIPIRIMGGLSRPEWPRGRAAPALQSPRHVS